MTKRSRPGKYQNAATSYLLDQFSVADLQRWQAIGKEATSYEIQLYFALERKRTERHAELVESLRNIPRKPFIFRNWTRIVDYQYAFEPLSSVGSIKTIGGRFNFGKSISEIRFAAFNALYLAEDTATAWREKFMLEKDEKSGGLSPQELKLADGQSLAHVSLAGQIEDVLDATRLQDFSAFLKIIRQFRIPAEVKALARRLKIRAVPTVSTLAALHNNLLDPNWKARPMQHDTPANSQIFGKIAYDAGFEGILYPSVRGAGRCLALFPKNFAGSGSFVELQSKTPNDKVINRLDSKTWAKLV